MKRREFIKLFGAGTAVASWPRTGTAQQQRTQRVIGYLQAKTEFDQETKARVAVFREALQSLGWVEGHNIQIQYRFGADTEQRARTAARELVSSTPDVILAISSLTAAALLGETPVYL
jgi:putative ABC transport system substrate-binding protein